MLRVVGRLPWLCACGDLWRQASDKPQGRKPRALRQCADKLSCYGDLVAGRWFWGALTLE